MNCFIIFASDVRDEESILRYLQNIHMELEELTNKAGKRCVFYFYFYVKCFFLISRCLKRGDSTDERTNQIRVFVIEKLTT